MKQTTKDWLIFAEDDLPVTDSESKLLVMINEVYIDARYPGDLGLLPNGKPTIFETEAFIQFCDAIYHRLKLQMN